MDDVKILGSYWTLGVGAYPHGDHEYSRVGFQERVEAAAKAGFAGIGLWDADLVHILQSLSLREMKRILDDHAMILELEFLRDWFFTDERRKASDVMRALLLSAAEALEARHVKVGDFTREPVPMPQLIDAFGKLCDEGAKHGTMILYEFMPFANIHSLADARALVEGAGRSNGGVILDLWHMVYMGISNAELATFPKQYVMGVELNDGKRAYPDDLHDATVNHRLLCGEGEFDIRGFLDTVRGLGFTGPYGIEVLNSELREMAIEPLCEKVYQTTIAQFR